MKHKALCAVETDVRLVRGIFVQQKQSVNDEWSWCLNEKKLERPQKFAPVFYE